MIHSLFISQKLYWTRSMKPCLPIVLPVLCICAMTQNPPAPAVPGQPQPGQAVPGQPQPSQVLPGQLPPALERSKGTQSLAPVPKPDDQPLPNALGIAQQINLTVDTAI